MYICTSNWVQNGFGLPGFEMFLFIGILALGLYYVWRKGHLDWVLPDPEVEESNSSVPKDLYEALNQKYARKS
jgi:NADH-quinone oxidoreductase subunit A